jgi:hypothetical protein
MRATRGLTLAVFCVTLCIVAKAGDIVWHKGSVVLATKEVVVGHVARQSHELLLFKDGKGEISVLPAHKISSFRYHDAGENVNRSFVMASNKFYERVVNGRISVWRIQKSFDQFINENEPQLFDFYIEDQKKVSPIKFFRAKFFDRIREELELQLVAYKHLDPNTKHGALSLILLYNQSAPAPTI